VDALVLTPDFPPAAGGIQLLMQRIVEQCERVTPRVITLGVDAGDDAGRVRRTDAARVLGHKAEIAWLNALAVTDAVRRRPDVVLCGHVAVGPAARLIRRAVGTPYVLCVYADELTGNRRLAAFALEHAAAVVAISKHTEELAREAGADPRRLHTILPGIDAARPALSSGDGPSPPTILTVARLQERYKGHDVLLRALALVRAKVPHAQLVVIGDGPLRPLYEAMAVSFGVANMVRFLGRVSDDARDEWLARADVFAMPSRLRLGGGGEGFGLVFLEAGARGVPSVAGDVAGTRDAVVNGRTGLLVDPTDHVAVADAIARVLTNPELARSLGAAAARRAQSLTWKRFVRQVEALLVEVAA